MGFEPTDTGEHRTQMENRATCQNTNQGMGYKHFTELGRARESSEVMVTSVNNHTIKVGTNKLKEIVMENMKWCI